MKKIGKKFNSKCTSKFNNIYPALFFVRDEYSNSIQVADLINTSLNSALHNYLKENGEININELPNYNNYLNIYWNLFEKNPNNGKIEGWGLKLCTNRYEFEYN